MHIFRYKLLILFLPMIAFVQTGQNVSISPEWPLIQDVDRFGVEWNVGDYVEYEVYEGDSFSEMIGIHTLVIESEKEINGVSHFQISTTLTQGAQKTVLSFYVEAGKKMLNLINAKEVVVTSRLGEFKVGAPPTSVAETFERVSAPDRNLPGEALRIQYSDDRPDARIWIDKSIPGYGLLEGRFWVRNVYRRYILSDFGNKGTKTG